MITEMKARLARPMPLFWKKMQKRSAATSAAFATLVVTVSAFSNHLPAILPTVFSYAAAFFGGIAAVCTLAVDDPATLPTADAAPAAEAPESTSSEQPA
jgi:hypothetical protein